ncbi:MAG TPA: hypothetical protein VFP21_01210 [Solirubrobacterales bacterium]|nr:hypothetical protein [Solirubrobacterales bacterium]
MGNATGALVNARNERGAIHTVSSKASRFGIFTITPSTSYASGGESFDFSTIGAIGRQPTAVFVQPIGGYVGTYDLTNKKLIIYKSAGSAAALVEASGDLSANVFTCLVFW